MDHDAVGHFMTEQYLLGELDPRTRDEFEEHFFDCPKCAADVHGASVFVERSKVVLAEKLELVPWPAVNVPAPGIPKWLAGLRSIFRPVFAVPVMALLLAVVGYQNLVTYPQMARQLNSPQVLPWASVNVGTYGSNGPTIKALPGQGFLLFVRIPPEDGYSHYTAELYNPAGKVESSVAIPASSTQDQWPVQVPGANRQAGSYTLKVHGITASGESKEVGSTAFELQIQK
jgi:hypothetical protein